MNYIELSQREASILWSAQCFKNIGDGPIKVAPSKEINLISFLGTFEN
jgi:hypothetical protein